MTSSPKAAPKPVSPEKAADLVKSGAVLIDVREPDEHARERIAGAVCLPLSAFDDSRLVEGPVVFHCRSRSEEHTSELQSH